MHHLLSYTNSKQQTKLETLAQLSAGQRDGCCCQADDDFGGWVKTTVLFLVVSGPKFSQFWDNVGDLCSLQCSFLIVYIMFLAEILALKVATKVVENR